ncbi:MAG: hypothetical protein ACRD3W_14995, partial [Terriglobales bacterium]
AIMGFCDNQIIFDQGACIWAPELEEAFNDWGASQGRSTWSARVLRERLLSHDVIKAARVKEVRLAYLPTRKEILSRFSRFSLEGRSLGSEVPARPTIWTGMRFRTSADVIQEV